MRPRVCGPIPGALALFLALPVAASVGAQGDQLATNPGSCAPTALNAAPAGANACIIAATPNSGTAIFNPLGVAHTVTFTCDVGVLRSGLGGASAPAGCYDVTAAVQDITDGSAPAIQFATCGGNTAAGGADGTVSCASVSSPICPVTTSPTTNGTSCSVPVAGTVAGLQNAVQLTFNPGPPHAYTITFSGYVPSTGSGACPPGTTVMAGVFLHTTRPAGAVGPTTACQFTIVANKKYVEVTKIQLIPLSTCGGPLYWVEGLKGFYGPPCTVQSAVTGMVILKTGVDCNNEPPNVPAALPSDVPPGATYACSNGTLSVTNIPVSTNLNFTVTGPAGFASGNTLSSSYGVSCNGSPGVQSMVVPSGTPVTVCAIGAGQVTVGACLAGPLPASQPMICDNGSAPTTPSSNPFSPGPIAGPSSPGGPGPVNTSPGGWQGGPAGGPQGSPSGGWQGGATCTTRFNCTGNASFPGPSFPKRRYP